ncbi:o-succinylbenzoate synthase [Dechloromonas sp. ZY10]|uniref:o-succinylbenzoate synthase n=1 Tax=Dechloromonas aquae TaxID=2664436 RepID=UPI00352916E5
MKIVAATWFPYTLPLLNPWVTSRGRREHLSGQLLRLSSADGLTGWGDAAPLPEFSISAEQARHFARETALLDLCAQARQLPLHQFLSQGPWISRLRIHENLGNLAGISESHLSLLAKRSAPVCKIKVGIQPWGEEIDSLRRVTQALPANTRLRLDANQAWNQADAQAFIKACSELQLPIESLEEPLQVESHNTELHAALGRLQQCCEFPLAIDESADLIAPSFWQAPPVRRIIIKPARHGGLLGAFNLARRARLAGLECVVTSALESNCGVLACAHLAAAIAPTTIHGLHHPRTEGHLNPSFVRDGNFYLPKLPGLGLRP